MMDIEQMLGDNKITFDPARCNHLEKTAGECPHCLQYRIAELESQLAESQRREGLLFDLVENIRNGDPAVEFMPAYKAAIDGGALD